MGGRASFLLLTVDLNTLFSMSVPCRLYRVHPSLARLSAVLLCLLALLLATPAALLAATPESGEALISEVIRRARAARKAPHTYEFTRTKISIFYKSEKEIANEQKKVYRTSFENGKFRTKLISINDQPPPPGPSRAPANTSDDASPEKSKETQRPRSGRAERGAGADSILSQIGDDAVQRFDYAIVGRETHEGRATLVVEVKPKKGLKTRTIEEEVMAQLAGKVWVDEEDREIFKADVALQDSVKVGWGGVLGALRELKLSVARSRIPTGEWINASSEVWIHFRQLFTAKRIRLKETVSDVQPASTLKP